MPDETPSGTGTGTDQAGETQGQPAGDGQGSPQGAASPAGTADGGEEGEAASLLQQMMAQDPEKLAQDVMKWKALARKHEKAAKDLAGKAKQWDTLQESQKSELQKAQEAAAAAEQRAAEIAANHSRVMAAATHDLPVELIDVLGAGTDDEIMGRAESIATAINARAQMLAKQIVESMGLTFPANGNGGQPGSSPTAAGAARLAGMAGTRPVESMRPGSAPASGGSPRNREEWFRTMIGSD